METVSLLDCGCLSGGNSLVEVNTFLFKRALNNYVIVKKGVLIMMVCFSSDVFLQFKNEL